MMNRRDFNANRSTKSHDAAFENSFENRMLNRTKTEDYQNAQSPFYATRNLFKSYLNYTKPLSYEEWLAVADDDKAAVLYVQFFEQITLAWYKTRSFYTLEEDGVETILQYLVKNVPIIEQKKSAFAPAYIYRVAFNCLYCICHDIQRDRDRFELETSNLQYHGDEVFDLFEGICDSAEISDIVTREGFWAAIRALGLSEDMETFVYSLADVTRPKRLNEEKRAVIEQLKIVLSPFIEVYYK